MVKINKTLKREIKSTIKNNIKRYLSLIAIIFLGVFFYVGMKSNAPVLENTMISYFNNANYMDTQLISLIGIKDSELKEIKKRVPEIKNIEGAYQEDTTTSLYNINTDKTIEYVVSVHSYNKNNKMNRLDNDKDIKELKPNECIADPLVEFFGYKVGDKIKFSSEKFINKELIIKGFSNSPLYISIDKGNSALLSGKIQAFFFMSEDNFKHEDGLYNTAYVDIDTPYEAFSSDYDNYIKKINKKVKDAADKVVRPRLDSIVLEKTQELNSAEYEYETNKEKAEIELGNAKEQIVEGEQKISEAEKKILSDKEIDMYLISAKTQLDMSKAQLESAKATIELAKKTLNDLEKSTTEVTKQLELKELQSKLDAANKILMATYELVDVLNRELEENRKKCENVKVPGIAYVCNETSKQIKTKIDEANAKIQFYLTEIKNIKEMIKVLEGMTALDTSEYRAYVAGIEKDYNAGLYKYNKGLKEYNYAKRNLKPQMKRAKAQIEEKKKELEEAKKTYYVKEKEVKVALDNAYKKLSEGKKLLKSLKEIKMISLTRNDSYAYSQYYSDIQRVDNLSKILPLVFFLVAALVTGSSITRMASEERSKIGTFKSLGYDKKQIMYKYLVYSGSAALIGIIFGAIVGVFTFPKIFSVVYSILYFIPKLVYQIDFKYLFIAIICSLLSTVIVAFFSVKNTTKEQPSNLMRAETGKKSNNIFLEKHKKFWKKLPFMKKITYRNMFGSIKRSLMTVLGVAGCTALIIAAFGTRTSISNIIYIQFGEIFDINSEFFFKPTLTDYEKREEIKHLEELNEIDSTSYGYLEMVDFKKGNKTYSVYNISPDKNQDFEKIIHMKDINSDDYLALPKDGVLLSEKIAKLMEVKPGDKIEYIDPKGVHHKVKISGVFENYVFHYMFMSKEYMEKINGVKSDNNLLLLKYKKGSNDDSVHKLVNKNNKFSNYLSLQDAEDSYKQVIGRFNIILFVIIISAGLLAFVVLYNLAKINISERLREIATLKVLGFRTKEVNQFINNEMNILTIIGIIFGCVLGRLLTELVVTTCELDTIMFNHDIDILSFVYAIILTLIFSKVIDKIVKRDLKNIKMVESLKSLE